MYPKNAASPLQVAIGPVVQISDGAVQTSGCTVRILPFGGAEGNGGGTTAYSTDGIVLYTPTQAETNYASFVLIAKKTGCIPASATVVTTDSATAGRVNVSHVAGTAQTGRDIGASVLLSSGNGTGQIELSSGKVLLQATQTGVTIPTVTTLTNAPSDSPGVTTLLSRIVGTLATGTHNPQTGDSYAIVNNGTYGLSALKTLIDAITAYFTANRTEPGQGAPAASTTFLAKIDYLYKSFRNKKTQTSSQWSLYNDAGDTVDQKASVSDNGTTTTKDEIVTGP